MLHKQTKLPEVTLNGFVIILVNNERFSHQTGPLLYLLIFFIENRLSKYLYSFLLFIPNAPKIKQQSRSFHLKSAGSRCELKLESSKRQKKSQAASKLSTSKVLEVIYYQNKPDRMGQQGIDQLNLTRNIDTYNYSIRMFIVSCACVWADLIDM